MLTTDQLMSAIVALPLSEREAVLEALEESISNDHRRLADLEETEHLAICRERLRRLQSGEERRIPADEVMNEVFDSP